MRYTFDVETHLIDVESVAPRIVLAGTYGPDDGGTVRVRDDFLAWLRERLDAGDTLVNHGIGFDMLAAAAAAPDLLPAIFEAYASNRVGCTYMLTQLADISVYGTNKGGLRELDAQGRHLAPDQPFRPEGGALSVRLPKGYSLQDQARRWLGLELDKGDVRTSYADYDGVAVEDLPLAQIDYVLSDLCAGELWTAVENAGERAEIDLGNIWALSRRDFALRLVEARGRYTDPVQVTRLREAWGARLDRTFASLRDADFIREKPGPRERTKIVTGYSRPTAAKKWWADHWGLPSLSLAAVRRAMGEGAVHPAVVSVLLDYHRVQQWQDVPVERVDWLEWSGLWRARTRTELGDPAPTGEYVLSQAACQWYAEGLGVPEFTRTAKTNQIQFTPDNADLCGDPTFEDVVTYRRASNIMATIDRLAQGVDRPLHLRVNGLAETGRTTSGGGLAGLNDQNHRREYGFRECWIPRRGHAFVSVDYSQIELCALAQVQYEWFGSSALGDAINAGRDCHVVFASMLLGIDYDRGVALHHAGDPELKSTRQRAKAFNFGRPGGLAERTFVAWSKVQYGVDVPYSAWSPVACEGYVEIPTEHLPRSVWLHALPPDLAQAAEDDPGYEANGQHRRTTFSVATDPTGWQRVGMRWVQERSRGGRIWAREGSYAHLNSQWLTAFPEMGLYLDRVKEQLDASGGRIVQLRSNRTRANCTLTSAANSYFQGLVADGGTEALFRVQRECHTRPDSPLHGSAPVWFVHDEIGLEVPLSRLHDASYRCSEVMVETMREFIPRVKIAAEPAAMRRWTKAADEPRFGADGRLIPEEDWRLSTGWYDRAGEKYAQEHADVLDLFRRYGLTVMEGAT